MIQVRGAGCSRNLLALHHFSIRYRVGAKRHHMLCLNMCHDDKVSAAQCSTGITFSGFYPRFYRAGSKGFWGSGTHHMSVGSCQGAESVTQVATVCSCASTMGVHVGLTSQRSKQAQSHQGMCIFVCLGFIILLILCSYWLSGALLPSMYLQ